MYTFIQMITYIARKYPGSDILRAGIELFTFISLWVVIVVLPTNLSVSPCCPWPTELLHYYCQDVSGPQRGELETKYFCPLDRGARSRT